MDPRPIENSLRADIAASTTPGDLEAVRIKYLGRKGVLTAFLRAIGEATAEERPRLGAEANRLKALCESLLEARASDAGADVQIEPGARREREPPPIRRPQRRDPVGGQLRRVAARQIDEPYARRIGQRTCREDELTIRRDAEVEHRRGYVQRALRHARSVDPRQLLFAGPGPEREQIA